MFLALYGLVFAALLLHAPPELLDPVGPGVLVAACVVLAWRHGWGLVHAVRAQFYLRSRFPRLRRLAGRVVVEHASRQQPPAIYLVCTACRHRAETSRHVFHALIEEAARYFGPVTIVAPLAETADQRLIKRIFKRLAPPGRVRLVFVDVPARGRREALANGLVAVARDRPPADAVVAIVDGGTVLAPDTLARCLPFFDLRPELGVLTTDRDAVAEGGRLVRDWYRLHAASRQILMCSMSLSGRLLPLNGGLVFYRVAIATNPSFIAAIRQGHLRHPRRGRLELVAGADMSAWQWLLDHDWRMLHVPDVRVLTIEHPPRRRFLPASTRLMEQWYRNSRASSRAIALGPQRLGLFTWWSLVDQRLSMWTPLVAPLAAIALSVIAGPLVLYLYLLWLMGSRLLQALMVLTVRRTISGLYPVLILYGQLHGALVKSRVLLLPDRRGSTSEPIAAAPPGGRTASMPAGGVLYVHAVASLALFTAIAVYAGILPPPTRAAATLLMSRLF